MRNSREQQFTDLLREHTGNTTAHSLVQAAIINTSVNLWAALFGVVGLLVSGNAQPSTGFVVIEENELYYYSVTGMGKRQKIDARRKIAFERLERVRGRGGNKGMFNRLEIRWRNNNSRLVNLTLGGALQSQFPNQRENLNEIRKLITANQILVKPDKFT